MLRRGSIFITGFLLNALVLSTLILSRPAAVLACPDAPPKTLLQLYKTSETIYIARFAKTEKGEAVQKEEDYRVIPVKKYFDVSRTLKGDARKMFVLEEDEYSYGKAETETEPQPDAALQGADEHAEAEPEEGDEEYDGRAELKEGDTVILFLKRDEEDPKKTVVADYADGIRVVESADLKTYERRIRELNALFAAKRADDGKIVDWLVRLAEDPVTRWDGTFELLQAFENAEYAEARKQEEAENEKNAEKAGDNEPGTIIDVDADEAPEGEVIEGEDAYDNAAYAKLLTDAHKQRLTGILLNRDPAEKSLIKGDVELIDLVKRWGDAELGRDLVEKVRSGLYPANETARMMSTAAQIFGDKELSKLAEKYEEMAWVEESAEYDQEDEKAEAKDEPKAEDPKAETAEPVTAETEPATADPAAAETKAAAKKPTYGEMRAVVGAKFLARADLVIAKQKAIAAKKAQK